MPIFEKSGILKTGAFIDATKNGDNFRIWNDPESIRAFQATASAGELRIGSTDIVILASQAPYSARHHMIAVFNYEIMANHKDWTKPLSIYNFDKDVQDAYWAVCLNSIRELSAGSPEKPAILMQNSFNVVCNNEKGRETVSGRSTFYPHAHVVSLDMEMLEEGGTDTEKLDEERKLYERFSDIFMESIRKDFKRFKVTMEGEQVDVENFTSDYPHGYEMRIPDPLMGNMGEFSRLMRHHHEAYIDAMMKIYPSVPQSYWAKHWGKNHPFPSYRDYLYYDKEGFLRYRVSPVLVSPEGVLEAANIKLIRSNEIEPPFGSHEEFKQSLLAGAGRVIESASNLLSASSR